MSKHELIKIKNYSIVFIPIKGNLTRIECYINTGFIDEDETNSGISHLIEHVMTENWKKCKDSCPKYWKEKGTISNAYTSNTFVGYWITGLSKWAKRMLEYTISEIKCELTKKKPLKEEKIAVKEELLKYFNKPNWKLDHQFMKAFYEDEGISNSENLPLQIKNIDTFDQEKIREFCRKMYKPPNILFVVAGNYNKKEIVSCFQQKLTNLTCDIVEKKVSINKNKLVKYIKHKSGKKTEILIGFYAEIYPWDEVTIYFDLIETVLSSGLNSILLEQLRQKLKLIYGLTLEIESNITGTLTYIRVSTQDKNIKKVIEHTIAKLKQFISCNFSNSFLVSAKNKLIVQKELLCKNLKFWAKFYGDQYAQQLTTPKKKIITYDYYIKKNSSVNKKTLCKIAKKIFNFDTLKILYIGKKKSHSMLSQ